MKTTVRMTMKKTGNEIGIEGTKVLCEALAENTTLKDLQLTCKIDEKEEKKKKRKN